VKEQEFIAAERAMDARPPRVLFRHILPNVIGPLLIICSMDVPVVVTVEAGLSFLGLRRYELFSLRSFSYRLSRGTVRCQFRVNTRASPS
jgi:ABC-type dipeptide/oligopeptide/nickel transport system permease subunit